MTELATPSHFKEVDPADDLRPTGAAAEIASVASEPEQPFPAPDAFTLLTGHRRTDGSFKSTENLQSEYLRLTDNLIYKMTEGVEVENSATGEKERRKPDYVLFLDKSGTAGELAGSRKLAATRRRRRGQRARDAASQIFEYRPRTMD